MAHNSFHTDSRTTSPTPFDQSGRQRWQQGHVPTSSIGTFEGHLEQAPSRDPFQTATFGSSTSSLPLQRQQAVELQPLPKRIPSRPSPFGAAMRSHQGTIATASSAGSYDGRMDNSSFRSSAHNLAIGNDPHYNFTQNDSTLEVLSDRWSAYQAWWAKQYKEQPFYRIWTKSKWILLFSSLMLLGYSCAAFAVSLGYMLGHYENSVVVVEFHSNLVYITLAGSIMGIITALVGLIGTLRENRIWLSWYNLMLWPVFALYLSVGYIAFRRAKNHLRAHLKDEWVHSYSREQRLLVQRNLKCCGYQTPSYFGEYDLRCFPMTNLPGCQHKYNLHEASLLSTCWNASFILVPFQLFVMIAALLCSNHVDAMLRSGRPGLKTFKEQKEH